MEYARDAHGGRITDPQPSSRPISIASRCSSIAGLFSIRWPGARQGRLSRVVAAEAAAIRAIAPKAHRIARLRKRQGSLKIPNGPNLMPGKSHPQIALIRKLLKVAAPTAQTRRHARRRHLLRQGAGDRGQGVQAEQPDQAGHGDDNVDAAALAQSRSTTSATRSSSPTWKSGAGCPRTSANSTSRSTSPNSGPRRQGRRDHSRGAHRRGPRRNADADLLDPMRTVVVAAPLERAGIPSRSKSCCQASEPAAIRFGGRDLCMERNGPQDRSLRRRLVSHRHPQFPCLSAAGRRQCARRRQIPVPEQARGLSARHAEQGPVQRKRAGVQPRLHARAQSRQARGSPAR